MNRRILLSGIAIALPFLGLALSAHEAAAVPTAGLAAELAPLPRPDMSAMESTAQEKVRAGQAKVGMLLADQSSGEVELSEAFGSLGQLYHAYRLLDAAAICYRNAEILAPDDFRWIYYLALVRHAKGELAAAVEGYGRFLELRPGDLAGLIHSGNALLELNREAEAAARFERALEIDPQGAAALFGLGKAKAFGGDHAAAVRLFEQALEIQPEASVIHYPLAQSYRQLGDLDKARGQLQLRGQENVRFPDPLGDQIVRLEKSTALEIVLSLAREQSGEDFSEEAFLGFALSQFADVKSTIDQLKQGLALQATAGDAAASPAEQARIHYVLGGLLVNDGRDEEAIFHFENAIRLDGSLKDARIKLGNALARSGRFEDALARYSEVLTIAPRHPAALLKRAAALQSLERDRESIGNLQTLIEVDPRNVEAQIRLASALARLGEIEAALARFEAARALELSDAESAQVEAQMGGLERRRGDVAAAEAHLRRALEIDPARASVLASLGSLMAERGRMDEAAQMYARWGAIEPKNIQPRMAEVTALIFGGQHAAARERLEVALADFPDSLLIQDVLARHLAACPDRSVRDGRRAVELAQKLYERLPTPQSEESLAMAFAQSGNAAEAVRWQTKLIEENSAEAEKDDLARWQANLALYKQGQACCAGE